MKYNGLSLEQRSSHLILASGILLFSLIFSTGCYSAKKIDGGNTEKLSGSSSGEFHTFEARLETVRQLLKIPGMSAAIVQDQELVWAEGFGYADLENEIPAGPDTPYGLASVTKPVAAVLIMQLVEQDLLHLDDPVSLYGVDAGNDQVTIRHLLTHTSEGKLGTRHQYNGNRYGLLGGVIEGATGQSFAALLSEEILLPLDLTSTALNPISSWGASSNKSGEEFNLLLGAGEAFRQYPHVYDRLAQPYQLDQNNDIIPGMYHLYHNPAAGMISSVTDLASFDIALDQGILLGDEQKAEMLSPAVSTQPGRKDTSYGLGWYVQELEGQRLLWHTGRWSPSTSALYLKVPDQNLTFIVLANTDNLTVPFNGIGDGDISQSTLALSFLRYFVYPDTLGVNLPAVNWQGPENELFLQLTTVKDPVARRLLERELWSFRQAYASVGENDQVDKLLRVNRRAFPRSDFRNYDLFTHLPGNYPVIPPVISASALARLSMGILIWFALVMVSMAIMTVRVLRVKNTAALGKMIWLAGTLFLGPIAIIAHLLCQHWNRTQPINKWGQALNASVITATAYTIAWLIALIIIISSGSSPNPIAILGATYLVPLAISLCLFRIPLQVSQSGKPLKDIFKQNLLAEVITFNLAFATLFLLTSWVTGRLLTTTPQPTSPFFWATLSLLATACLVVLFPLHYWLTSRGYSIPSDQKSENNEQLTLPTLRSAWPTLLVSLGIMLAVMVFTISQVA